MRNLLNREQLRRRPETPHTIVELDVALMNYQAVQHIFKGTVLSDDGYRAVIFTSDALINVLASTTEIYMDGTFKVSDAIRYYLTCSIGYNKKKKKGKKGDKAKYII